MRGLRLVVVMLTALAVLGFSFDAVAASKDAGRGTEQCRVAVLKAAKDARASGTLGFFAYRRAVNLCDPDVWFKVDRKLFRQTGEKLTYGDQVAAEVLEQAVASGKLTQAQVDAGAIDWANLIVFIKELMPIIQQLIEFIMTLFASVPPVMTTPITVYSLAA